MVKLVRWIGVDFSKAPTYDGINGMDTFIQEMDSLVQEEYRMDVIDTTLKGTLTGLWGTHKDDFPDQETTQLTMMIMFKPTLHANMFSEFYMGETNLYEHNEFCEKHWESGGLKPHFWVHQLSYFKFLVYP